MPRRLGTLHVSLVVRVRVRGETEFRKQQIVQGRTRLDTIVDSRRRVE